MAIYLSPHRRIARTACALSIAASAVAEAYSNKQIAQILNISIKTVGVHRASVLRKLDLTSTAALVRYAMRNKLIEA